MKTPSTRSVTQACQLFRDSFPKDVLCRTQTGKHEIIAQTIQAYVPVGGRVLDYGCGAADKAAVLSYLGFDVTAYDAYVDLWHSQPGMIESITAYCGQRGIRHFAGEAGRQRLMSLGEKYDAVMLLDVIEHVPGSPRGVLIEALSLVKDDGLLIITVPNAANLRKRIDLLRGKTNYPSFEDYFFDPDIPWRNHTREYVRDDLKNLVCWLEVKEVEIKPVDFMLFVLPAWARAPFRAATSLLWASVKDSWLVVARKPSGWVAPPFRLSSHLRNVFDSGFVKAVESRQPIRQ